MRPWLACSTFVLAATAASPAAAQDALNGGKVDVELWLPREGKEQSSDENDYTRPSAVDVERYFNLARCQCDRAGAGMSPPERQNFLVKLSFATDPAPALSSAVPLNLFAGALCEERDADGTRKNRCTSLTAIPDARTLNEGELEVFARTGDLLAPGVKTGGEVANECGVVNDSTLVVVANASSQMPEDVTETSVKVVFDVVSPKVPRGLTPIALEEAIRISWSASDADLDTRYFQALCAKADGSPARVDAGGAPAPSHPARFSTTADICNRVVTAPVATDGTMGALPSPLAALDPRYVCGEAEDGTTQITLEGLENDVPYWVVLVAVDPAGNYDPVYVPLTIAPRRLIDFWEDLNEEDPGVDGGFCVSQVGRSGSAGSGLLVLAAVAVAARRRRRRTRAAGTAALTALALVALAPGAAHAQSFEPYWIDSEAEATGREDLPQWHLGLRVGPYHPAVDEAFTSDPGPFRRMFGPGYNLVPQLDLHRLWSLAGVQLGVGMSGGYYRKTAEVLEFNSDPSAEPVRVGGAINSFQMVPLSVSGLARLTVLDERWGIPVVPYARGGVAYNVWWVRTPTGDLAVTDCDTCEDKALGASAGLVGAVGLAIRGERLDSEAEHSMKNSGVEHAGFYVELETAWVDGFGNERRLSLGDTTWYAGVDFEF